MCRDGVFRWESSEATIDGSTTRWTVAECHLVIGDDAPLVWLKKLAQPLDNMLFKTLGWLPMIESDVIPLWSISEDEVLLRSPYLRDDGKPGRMRRIRNDQL